MRKTLHNSKNDSARSLPSVTPQLNTKNSSLAEPSEPMGHVHDNYRHWVWLGLHR